MLKKSSKKIIFSIVALLFSVATYAQVQTFSAGIGSTIDLTGANGSCATPGSGAPNVVPIVVSGVGTLGAGNAVTQIKVTLNNTCTGGSMNLNNLQFRLKSPGGTCVGVYNGGLSTTATGAHQLILVTNTSCLNNPDANASNTTGVSASTSGNYGFFNAQFGGTGTDLTASFSGENADGTWQLIFSENTASEPCLTQASLVFGNPAVDDQTPNGDQCTGAIVWDGGAICASTSSKTGSVLMPGSLTGPNGTSFGTIGGVACNWNQANNNDVWLKFTPTSANVCISISGLDFSLQSIVVQDANQDGDNNPCTANAVDATNDQRWTVVSCPNSSLYTTTAGTQRNQNHCFTAVVGQTYYLIVDGNGGAESPFYIGGVSGLPATEPAVCSASISYSSALVCKTGTATPTFSPAGGTFTTTAGLSIDPSTGVIDLATSTAGSYTVTYTPSSADPTCFDTFDLTLVDNTAPTATVSSQPTCFTATGIITITAPANAPNISYTVSGPTTTTNATGVFNGLLAGNYAVTATVNGCVSLATNLTVNAQPSTPSIAASPIITNNSNCGGTGNGGVDITVSGGASPYSYTWSNGTTNQDITAVGGGTYTVTVTGNNGCTAAGSATVGSSPSVPSIAASPIITNNSNCGGTGNGGVDITVSGGASPYSYTWSNGTTNQDITAVGGGTYTVTVTGNNGCTAAGSATVGSSPALPNANISQPNTTIITCNTPNISLTATGGGNYLWNAIGGNSTSATILATVAGTYIVTVTSGNGCSATAFTTISSNTTSPASPTATVVNVACNGGATGAINITPSGGLAPYSFVWSNGATTEDISNLSAGMYSVTVSGGNGCNRVASYSITQPAELLVAVQTTASCIGTAVGAINATASGGTTPYTYELLNLACTNIQISNNTGIFTNLAAGSYCVRVRDANNCIVTQSNTTVGTANGGPVLVSSENTSEGVGGVSPFAYNTHVIVVDGGNLPYNFVWDNSGYVRYDVRYTATGCVITIFYTDNANWEVSITDGGSCTSVPIVVGNSENIVDTPLDIYNYNVTPVTNLAGGSIQLFVEGGVACSGNTYYYEWLTPSGSIINTSGTSPATLNNQPTGWYSVVVTDCGNDGIHGNADDQETIGWYWIPEKQRGRNKEAENIVLSVSPNPFSDKATIEFYLPKHGWANIAVYDITGKQVAVLFNGETKANEMQSVIFNSNKLPAGVYAVILTTQSGDIQTQKTVLIK